VQQYKPDGDDSDCLYHRNDQSILSIEALKNNIYPEFNESIDLSFGDFQSVCVFYPDDYLGDVLNNLNRYVYPSVLNRIAENKYTTAQVIFTIKDYLTDSFTDEEILKHFMV
jgi:hypothetical protein